MLGDTNIVEDMVDRLPCHKDNTNATQALAELKNYLQLKDGWQEINPTTTAFTFMQLSTGSQSRIDCIYIANELASSCHNWGIKATHIPTDHKMVMVKLIDLKASYIGQVLGTCQIDKGNLHEWRSMECMGFGKAISNITLELKL